MIATFPSYVDFDRFIDVERLRALDGFIADRIADHIRSEQDSFFLNQHRLDASAPHAPGVREIWLSRTRPGTPYNYLDLDRPEQWEPTPEAEEFAPLMDFIATLPFAATARMLIIYDNAGNSVPAHRDHEDPALCHEFIWMRTRFTKRFYMLDPASDTRCYVNSHAAWFDSVNQYHGADGSEELSFSIRVDGIYSDALRAQIPFCRDKPSATPALWAAALKASAAEDQDFSPVSRQSSARAAS